MPAFYRQRSNSPTMGNPVSTGIADLKMVGFAPQVVTAVSRPLSNSEQWALYRFETHARHCDACFAPYAVHRSGGRLCTSGHTLAQDVARYVYSLNDVQETYSASEDERMVRVEIPQGYECVRGLLRAMERSLRHRRQKPIVSFDRTYHIQPRESPNEKKREKRESPVRQSPPRRRIEIVDWPENETKEPVQPVPAAVKELDERVNRWKRVERRDQHLSDRAEKPKKSERSERVDSKPLDKLERRRSVAVSPSSSGSHSPSSKQDKRRSTYDNFDVEVRGPSSRSSPSRRSRRYSSIFG